MAEENIKDQETEEVNTEAPEETAETPGEETEQPEAAEQAEEKAEEKTETEQKEEKKEEKKEAEKKPAKAAASEDKPAAKPALPPRFKSAHDRVPDDEKEPVKEEKKKEESSKTVVAEDKKEKPKQPAIQKKGNIFANQEKKPNESEAIKSLREKIVKGKVSLDDLKTGKNNNQENKNQSGGQKPYKDKNNKNQQPRDNKQSNQQAPVMDDSRGKGKGGRNNKGKYEKQKGDKFERFENEKGLLKKQQEVKEKEEEIKVITLPDTISVKDFAAKLKMQPAALIKKLFLQGQVLTVNDILDFETAEAIALDMDIICEHEVQIDYIEELLKEEAEDESKMVKRPPVVCVMGHVDHGKTSLLDAIRKTNITAREAGGITQHIGAYQVTLKSGEKLTFLDTPGHEAFTAMRLRGAMATDVAILVVAADDGVMPQTVEAISHAKAAGIHVIVAVNKIDKPGANVDRVKQELTEYGLIAEDWGGDTIFCPISAKTGEGVSDLLDMVILDTEILDLKANPDRKARGLVIEAKLDKGRGTVATLLVQKGTLKVGDFIAMGESYGKVRAMSNAAGERVKEAGPSVPVEITGMNGVPEAGEVFVAFEKDKDAKAFAQVYVEENKKKLLAGTKAKMSLNDVFDQMKAGEMKDLELIIKADVQGSVGALKESLEKLSNDEVNVKVIHSGVGNVTEGDAILASASNAIIIAFNVSADAMARDCIEHEKVDMRTYNVIYNAIDDVELAMKGMLKPIYEEEVIGHIEVRQTFKASGVGVIAGSYITDGLVKRDAKVRLTREGTQLFEGGIASLKRFNDDVKEVKAGYECGIVLEGFQDIKEGDLMEAYIIKEVKRN